MNTKDITVVGSDGAVVGGSYYRVLSRSLGKRSCIITLQGDKKGDKLTLVMRSEEYVACKVG